MFKRNKKYQDHSDEELILLYKQAANRNVVAVLYERYAHLVMGTALKYLQNQKDAEDITMTVFESLFKKLLVHEVQYFKSWLYMVTKNECLMALRKQNKQGSIENTNYKDVSEDYNVEIDKQLDLLNKMIEELKPIQQKCIVAFFIDEKSYALISDELNLSLKEVKSAIQNGKRMLKIKMENEIEKHT